MMSEMRDRDGWWVFDRPLIRDPLFVVAIVFGACAMAVILLRAESYGVGGLVLSMVAAFPVALLAVGISAGSIREFWRARRWDRRPSVGSASRSRRSRQQRCCITRRVFSDTWFGPEISSLLGHLATAPMLKTTPTGCFSGAHSTGLGTAKLSCDDIKLSTRNLVVGIVDGLEHVDAYLRRIGHHRANILDPREAIDGRWRRWLRVRFCHDCTDRGGGHDQRSSES